MNSVLSHAASMRFLIWLPPAILALFIQPMTNIVKSDTVILSIHGPNNPAGKKGKHMTTIIDLSKS
ncbi:MAG: hypothetical protein ACOCS6_02525, partial [Desulfosalsimonas sp.]